MADRFRSLYDDKEQIKRLDKVTILDSEATPLTPEANKKTNVKDLHKKEIFDIDANTTITASQGQIFFNSTKATGTHDFTINTTSLQVGDTIWIKKSGDCDSISLIAGSGVTIRTVQSATEIGDLLIITKIATAVFSCVKIKSESGTEIPTYNLEQDSGIPEKYNVTISGVTTNEDLPYLFYVVFDFTEWTGSYPTTTAPYMNINESFSISIQKFHNSQTTSIFHEQIEPNVKWLVGKSSGRIYFVNPPIAEANFITYTTSGTNGIAYSIPLGVNQTSFVAKLNTALITAVSQPTLSFAGGTAYPLLNGYTGEPFTNTTLTVDVAYHFIKDGDFYRVLVPPAGSTDTNIFNSDGVITASTERIVEIEAGANIKFEGTRGITNIGDGGLESVSSTVGGEETRFENRNGVQSHGSDLGIPLKSDAYYEPTSDEHYAQKKYVDDVSVYITEYVDTELDNKIDSASNGITKTGTNIKLGGSQPLIENTTILGDATGTFDFAIGKSTNIGATGARIKNFIVKLKEKVLWGIQETGVYHYFNWGEDGLEMNGEVTGVRSYTYKIGEEINIHHQDYVTNDGYYLIASKDELYLNTQKDNFVKEIYAESGENDNGIIVTDTNLVGLKYGSDYTTKQLLNDRAVTDVGGIKILDKIVLKSLFITDFTHVGSSLYEGTSVYELNGSDYHLDFPATIMFRIATVSSLGSNLAFQIDSLPPIYVRDENGAVITSLNAGQTYTAYKFNTEYRVNGVNSPLLPDGSFWIKTVFNSISTLSGTAISGGSLDEVSLGTGSKYTHLAMIKSHASNANSGARTNFSGDKALYPNLMREYIFHIPSVACTTRSARFGLMRPTYLPSTPPYGVWFDISNLTFSCSCVSTPNTTTHATTYTLALNTTYKALIEVNTALTSVNFKLFVAGNSTSVLDNDITTNIPTDNALIDIMMAIASEGASKEIIGFASWGSGDRNGYNKIG